MNEQKQIESLTFLYPFNGRSPNLIDKFYIFGYNYSSLKKFLIDETPKISEEGLNKDGLGVFKLDEKPSILFEIANNSEKELVDNEIVQKIIIPNNLYFFYRIEDNNDIQRKFSQQINLEKENDFSKIDLSEEKAGYPKSFRSVFSISFPLEDKNSKSIQKNQNGFAYTFYRKLLEKKEIEGVRYIIYVPYTFCIISEFPFYKSFEKLFRCIRKIFSQQLIYIPIEILLHKIINLTPSPLNSDVVIDLDLMVNQNKLVEIESNYNKRTTTEIKIEEDIHFENKMMFKYLSGFPLIQYNLAKVLFHRLSIDKIIKIFLFIFIEKDVIFFSEDIEYLSLSIDAYKNFNFPLTDCQYFYNVGAISLEAFQRNDNFGIKAYSSIMAINNRYVDNYLSKINRPKAHSVVDLDNGELKIMYHSDDKYENESFERINEIIENILQKKAIIKIWKKQNYLRR